MNFRVHIKMLWFFLSSNLSLSYKTKLIFIQSRNIIINFIQLIHYGRAVCIIEYYSIVLKIIYYSIVLL